MPTPIARNHSPYNNLRGGSVLRMRDMRIYVSDWNNNPRHMNPLDSWRDARKHGIGKIRSDAHGLTGNSDDCRHLPLSVADGFRDAGESRNLIALRHKGWFRDVYGDETYAGHVWQLPARDGEPRFIAGYIDDLAEYVVLSATRGKLDIFNNAEDAARAGDSLAESHAKREREYNEKWIAARALQDANDGDRVDLKAYRVRFGGMKRAYRAIVVDTVAREAIREAMDEARDNFRECLARIIKRNDEIADYAAEGVDV